MKIGRRVRDATPISLVELVVPETGKKKKKAPKKAAKEVAAKKLPVKEKAKPAKKSCAREQIR